MSAFFDMGGYGAFIWPSFGLWFVVMGALALVSLADRRRQRRKAQELEAMLGGRKRARRVPGGAA